MTKRIFDFTCALIGIVLLFPFFILFSILIKFDSKGPILFRQNRIGKDGKTFVMIKFRSMSVDKESNISISITGDKRITKAGFFLRKYKFDELPELWNVLVGEMSLVGPRPDVPGYADKLIGKDRNILRLRPGITGPASIKYANEEEILAKKSDPIQYNDEVIFPDKVKINLEYCDNHSIWLDIKIIFATIFRRSY